jgi:hypothetical protein
MSKKISGYKIDHIADSLTESLSKKINSLITERTLAVQVEIKKLIPNDVFKFYEKYPDLVKTRSSIYDDTRHLHFEKPLPYFDVKFKDLVSNNKQLETFLNHNENMLSDLKDKRTTLRNQIKCTLSKLSTYAKIRNEFPEAYKELMVIDETPIDSTENLCGDVEALRAELSSSNK